MRLFKSWGEFYQEELDLKEFSHQLTVHHDFFSSILSQRPKKILEAGCGTALFSIHLSKLRVECVAVDRDLQVLELARKNNQKMGGNVHFINADIQKLPFREAEFDLSFSQGVFEHYSDQEIRALLDEQLRVSKQVCFSVPHFFYLHKDFGNERLLPKWYWEKILKGYSIVESRCYYAVRRKKTFFLKFPQMYMAKIQLCASQ